MTAILATAVRDTKALGFDPIPAIPYNPPVAANVNCRQGGIAAIALSGATAGYAAPATASPTLQILGRFEESFNNTGGANGGSSLDAPIGRTTVRIRSGAFWFANSAGADAIAQTNVYADCYAVDDQTVALTDGGQTRSRAGKILAVDAALGVLVLMGPEMPSGLGGGAKIQVVSGVLLANGAKVVGGVGGTFSLTASSVIIPVVTAAGAGAMGTHYIPVVTATGAPGTAQFTVTATSTAGAAVNTDVNTLAFLILN